jgi:hypothetical protein
MFRRKKKRKELQMILFTSFFLFPSPRTVYVWIFMMKLENTSPKTETVDCWLFLELRRSSLVRWTINVKTQWEGILLFMVMSSSGMVRWNNPSWRKIFHFNGFFVSWTRLLILPPCQWAELRFVQDAYIQLRTLAMPSRVGNWPLFLLLF